MNTVTDKISVIIPVYNRQDVIEECVSSILAQSYQNFEIIIIDDGSTDNTAAICEKLAQGEPRIVLLAGEHGGVSAARNIGLDAANGEYIFFIDSDDVIYPLLLETLLSGMKSSNAGIGGSGVINTTENNWDRVKNKLTESPTPGETTYHTHEETLELMFCSNSPLSCIGGVMMRRDLIGDTKFRTDIYIGEDYYFIYENLIKGASAVFLRQKWYYVRLHENNSSWDYSYGGFFTRFYRRKLVWESEEALGRKKYADKQKRDAFGRFVVCIRKNNPYSKDGRLMRKTMKEYKKVLIPAYTFKGKMTYILNVYFPLTAKLFYKVHDILSGLKKRKK